MTSDVARDRIFISYRRDDASGSSGRVYDWLRIAFGRDRVFRDVASIGVGKWRDRIDAALARSMVCLPVIGPRWCDEENGPRLFRDDDVLRQEIAGALTREGITVIPTLVEGAELPSRDQLPESLLGLLDWQAVSLSEVGWEDDIGRLVKDIADCAHLAVAEDFELLLASQSAAETRVRGLRDDRKLRGEQIQALTDTVTALTRRLAERPEAERADLAHALADLARGETGAAESEFQRVLDTRAAEAKHAAHEAAEAARHLANLALFNDLRKAIGYYRQAADLERGNPENWRLLGNAYLSAGDTGEAEASLLNAREAARMSTDIWEEMAADTGLGDLARTLGKLKDAAHHYQAASSIASDNVSRQPRNGGWQGNLSVVHNKLGDVLEAQGDDVGATAAYRRALAIRETLVTREPANLKWQRDLAVSHGNLGVLLAKNKEYTAALSEFQAGLKVFEDQASGDPDDPIRQRDISVSQEKIGECLLALGNAEGALTAYRASLGIREILAGRNQANTEWQRDLSVSHNKVGDALLAMRDMSGALDSYRKSLDIAEALAERDRENADWQRDLIVSYVNLADASSDPTFYARALDVATAMQARGSLAPKDAWMLEVLARRVDAGKNDRDG